MGRSRAHHIRIEVARAGSNMEEGSGMIRYAIAIAVVGLPLAAAAAQSDQGPPRWMANIARKQHVVMYGVPRPYSAARDPSPGTTTKLRRGSVLFDRHCAACHGWSGQGTGPDAFGLVPAPADLEWLARTPKSRADPYIYWSIAEGGKEFGSEMPAFKRSLSSREIWAVTAYLRAGMPYRSP
jgi:mono/diheme cytochrome c family protein